MTRPIVWAVATFGAIAVAATVAGERLAKLAAKPTIAVTSPAANPIMGQDQIVTVQGDRRGHFMLDASVDGGRLTMMVDTGASIVALSQEEASRLGIKPFPSDFRDRISTANGDVKVARVSIRELRIGSIVARDVEAVVVPFGRLDTSLLGMSFLKKLRGFDIAGNQLTLRG